MLGSVYDLRVGPDYPIEGGTVDAKISSRAKTRESIATLLEKLVRLALRVARIRL